MSDDRRINIRASLYPVIEAAAARRHVPIASFVAMVLSEYLLKHNELNVVKPTHVATKYPTPLPAAVQQAIYTEWSDDEDDE